MTATSSPASACPECGSHYATALETGMMFCPECRNEWNPRDVVQKIPDELIGPAPRPAYDAETGELDVAGSYDTVVYVTHDDGGSGNIRTDRYTHHTSRTQSVGEAFLAATSHFTLDIGSEVLETKLAERIPDDGADLDAPEIDGLSTLADADEQWPECPECNHRMRVDPSVPEWDCEACGTRVSRAGATVTTGDVPSDEDKILATAYLSTLTGTGLTLEGGQRATLLDFVDDDHLRAQLATGEVVILDFNDVIRADEYTPDDVAPAVELDDETAELFGSAALTLACLVIEAGVASVDGDGDTQHLVEPPSGWFPPDEDAIPLMEQASAGAVAMLIQTFGLPRDELGAMVARVREGVTAVPDVGDEHDE